MMLFSVIVGLIGATDPYPRNGYDGYTVAQALSNLVHADNARAWSRRRPGDNSSPGTRCRTLRIYRNFRRTIVDEVKMRLRLIGFLILLFVVCAVFAGTVDPPLHIHVLKLGSDQKRPACSLA